MIDAAWGKARSLLLVRLDNLGDVLVTTPAIRAVRSSLSGARITLLCSPVGAQVGRLNPDIDDVIEAETPWMDPWNNLTHDPQREQRLLERIKREGFDGAIIFTSFRQSPLPAAYLCYMAGIPLRLGASIDGAGSLLTTRVKHDADLSGEFPHEVRRSLDLIDAIGIPPAETGLVLSVPVAARESARGVFDGLADRGGPTVVLHPGCSMPARTYPAEMFREVVARLVDDLRARVVVTGVEAERDLADFVLGSVDSRYATSIAGRASFELLCGLIDLADATVCSNTGPMHISAAVGTPVVVAFALTNPPQQWAPWGVANRQLYRDVPCRICYRRVCPYQHECLTGVAPREVVNSVRDLLADRGDQIQPDVASLVGAA